MRDRAWHVVFGILSVACVLIYFQIFALNLPSLPHPDELSAFDIFGPRGLLEGIEYYWTNLIGRPSSMGWLGLPAVLADLFDIDPWYVLVTARAMNFVLVLVSATVLVVTVFPKTPALLSVAVSAALVADAFSGAGTTSLVTIWLADQAIYLLTFIALCLVLALFWRIAQRGLDVHAWWLVPIYALYLGAQEVNLVTGGLILALYFLGLLYGRVGPVDWRWQSVMARLKHPTPEPRRRWSLFLVLAAVYVLCAYVQLASPSVAVRLGIWPAQASWLAALGIGLPAAFIPAIELGFGLNLPLFLCGTVLGAWQESKRSENGGPAWLLLAPLACAILTSVLMAVLSARYGLLAGVAEFPDARLAAVFVHLQRDQLSSRQSDCAYLLWVTGILFGGAYLGVLAVRRRIVTARVSFEQAGAISVGWLALTNLLSSPFTDSWRYDWPRELAQSTRLLRPLGQPAGLDQKRYLAELLPRENPLHIWAGAAPKYGGYPVETALRDMFPGAPIEFVPCAVAGAAAECHDPDLPRVGRKLDSSQVGNDGLWRRTAGGQARPEDGRLAFSEDVGSGEHYLATGEFLKSARTLVQVKATVDASAGREVGFGVVSTDGSASITFDLGQAKISGHAESGARALDGSIRNLSHAGTGLSRFELRARFVVFGDADRFQVRLESSQDGRASYQGDGHSGWVVENSRIRLLDSGEAALMLQPKPTLPARLYAGAPD